jgi:hypothetical protein
MDDQMTKARLLDTLRTKRAEWDAVLAHVPAAQMSQPGVVGEWSVKDLIVHLTYHERWYADRLHEMLRGEGYTPTEMDHMDFDERNDRIFQQNRNRSVEEVLAESRQVFDRLVDGVQAHAEEFLIEPQHLGGAPQPITVWKLLRGAVYDHYGQHIPSIKHWLATRQP